MGQTTRHDGARPVLHRAPWVLCSPFSFSGSAGRIIENGCVVTEGSRIAAAGPFSELKDIYTNAVVRDHEQSVLLPALVNAHAHLELSCLSELGKSEERFYYFTDWIRKLLQARSRIESHEEVTESAVNTLLLMSARGVGLIADIGNKADRCYEGLEKTNRHTTVIHFIELLGLSGTSEQRMLEAIESFSGDRPVAAHAPYSTSPKLIGRIKQSASQQGHVFSIHVAESGEEVDFLRDGKGCFRDFLEERGAWDGSFTPPGCGAITYLDQLGVLDSRTMCVHAVHISEEEIALLADRRAKICLCPASNRQLSSGIAPVTKMLAHKILPALGTDSLASNSTLDIWREMQLLREDHPDVDPAVVFSMATRGGAESLGYGPDFGELSAGKQAAMISVRLDGKCDRPATIYDFLTTAGASVDLQWAE